MKTFEIEEPLSYTKKEKLLKHSINSCIWYLSNYMKSSQELRDKLLAKGIEDREYSYKDNDGAIKTINIVQQALDFLNDQSILNDYLTAENYVINSIESGKSIQKVKQKLFLKKFDKDIVDEIFENNDFSESIDESVKEHVKRYMKSMVYTRNYQKDPYKARQKMIMSIVGKGFSFYDVMNAVNDVNEE